MAIGIALLGAGIFARSEHLPGIEKCSALSLKAIYSRSQKSAEALAHASRETVDCYYDSPYTPSKSLEALLKRDDIQAVIIGVPITAQPGYIKQALAAGKHVLSEKPIAKDLETACDLIRFYEGHSENVDWAVGENFRFWKAVTRAAEILRSWDARILTFRNSSYTFIDDDNVWLQTKWRNKPDYQGGFLLDGGIHSVAVTRFLLAALGQSITSLSAFTSSLQPKLGPVDTIQSVWQTSSGISGTFSCSFGTDFKDGLETEIVTDRGSVVVKATEVVTNTRDEAGNKKETKAQFLPMAMGVTEEIAVFARGVETRNLDPRLSPQEALADLQVLEAMLKSGENKGQVRDCE